MPSHRPRVSRLGEPVPCALSTRPMALLDDRRRAPLRARSSSARGNCSSTPTARSGDAADRLRRGASPGPCACRATSSALRACDPRGELARRRRACRRGGRETRATPPRGSRARRACGGSPPGCRCRRTPRRLAPRHAVERLARRRRRPSSAAGRCSTSHQTACGLSVATRRRMASRSAGVEHVGPAQHDDAGAPQARRPARAACRAAAGGRSRTARSRRAARCRGRAPAGGAGSRRRARAAATRVPRPRRRPTPTRSGFCRCGTSGSASSSSSASSLRPSAAGAVAAAEDGHAHAALRQVAGDPLDHRRLARAADGEIADAHHRHGRPVDVRGAAVEPPIARGDRPAVGHARRAQPGPHERGRRPAAAAADDVAKCGGGDQVARGLRDSAVQSPGREACHDCAAHQLFAESRNCPGR